MSRHEIVNDIAASGVVAVIRLQQADHVRAVIDALMEGGADVIKVFPATALGPGFFKDVRGPLPQVKMMPTGGVSKENAGDWIKAGAVAIGVGTALVDAAAVKERRFDAITKNAVHFITAVSAARGR